MTPTIQDIIETSAAYHGLPESAYRSAKRPRRIARPRQIAMYLSRKLTSRSLPEIGRAFGGRDHTTVIHACRRITWFLEQNDQEIIDAIVAIASWAGIGWSERSRRMAEARLCLAAAEVVGEACRALYRAPELFQIAPLTPAQRRVYEAIRAGHNTPSRLRSRFDLSDSATGEHFRNLVAAGAIERVNVGVYRAIEFNDALEAM